jgi:hypothetical protein
MKTIIYFSISVILCVLLNISIVRSQCNVKVERTQQLNSYIAGAELLYSYNGYNDNGDKGQGVYAVIGNLSHYVTPNKTRWALEIVVKAVFFKSIVPRNLVITFTNGTTLKLYADTNKKINGAESCLYFLSEFDIKSFQYRIKSIEVIDNRQNKKIGKAIDYPNILVEQYNCIIKRI